MVVVNISSNIVFVCSQCDAARIIGVHPKTIYNWKQNGDIERYNNWMIYFDVRLIKQNKGEHFKK